MKWPLVGSPVASANPTVSRREFDGGIHVGIVVPDIGDGIARRLESRVWTSLGERSSRTGASWGVVASMARVLATCVFRLVMAYRRMESLLKKLPRQDSVLVPQSSSLDQARTTVRRSNLQNVTGNGRRSQMMVSA